jgi:hypothetical protein
MCYTGAAVVQAAHTFVMVVEDLAELVAVAVEPHTIIQELL